MVRGRYVTLCPWCVQHRINLVDLSRQSTIPGETGTVQPCSLELRDVLSAYDATYVALAEGLRADLITADRRLARGAEALGVSCLPA